MRIKSKETDDLESIVVVDGVPQFCTERTEILLNIILPRLFQRFGKTANGFSHFMTDSSIKG